MVGTRIHCHRPRWSCSDHPTLAWYYLKEQRQIQTSPIQVTFNFDIAGITGLIRSLRDLVYIEFNIYRESNQVGAHKALYHEYTQPNRIRPGRKPQLC